MPDISKTSSPIYVTSCFRVAQSLSSLWPCQRVSPAPSVNSRQSSSAPSVARYPATVTSPSTLPLIFPPVELLQQVLPEARVAAPQGGLWAPDSCDRCEGDCGPREGVGRHTRGHHGPATAQGGGGSAAATRPGRLYVQAS